MSHAAFNATLNALSTVFLLSGFYFIRRRNILAHRICMSTALLVSTVFLVSYVLYHSRVGSVPFTAQGFIRPVYFTLLISHVILAAAILPLALITLIRALRQRFDAHRRIARWTLPIWLYVSITGVVIYLLLYHLYPSSSLPMNSSLP